jgi:hypothetical protein
MPAGRPPKSIIDLDSQLGAEGDILTIDPPKQVKLKEPENYIFQMVGKFPKDSRSGATRYPGLQLSNCQIVYDEETNSQRTARLLRGIPNIWQDEQKDNITEKMAARLKPDLSFNNGQLIIPATNKSTVMFLQLCSDFEGCKHPVNNRKIRYRLLDTEAAEAKLLELKKIKKEASDLAWKTPMDALTPHAKYLGINSVNEEGLPKSDDAMRADYVDKAEAQPALFLKTYNNPKVKMYGFVKKAFEGNVIIYVDGQAQWTDTKAVICQVPYEKQNNVADYLAELMLTKEGMELKTRLETL